MRISQNTRDYFAIGDRDDLTYEEKLGEYRRLADAFFQVAEYEEFCAQRSSRTSTRSRSSTSPRRSSTSCSSRP